MKIAIYYPWVYLRSGIERTILETVKRSKHEYTLFTNHFERENTFTEFKNVKLIQLTDVPVKRDLVSVCQAALTIIFQKIDLTSYDLLLVHSDGLGDLITLRNQGIPSVCFCHTPLRPVFDYEYREKVLKNKFFMWRLLFYFFSNIFRYIDKLMWKNYKYVFFNSKETQRRAMKGGLLSQRSRSSIGILHPGIDFYKTNLSRTHKPYFLLPGRIMWTKNIELAIEAFKIFKKTSSKKIFKLIIAGQVDEKSKEYYQKLLGLRGRRADIKFITKVTDSDMKIFYKECFAVLSTAFNEDWGITLLEGNAAGKLVIGVNKGGPKESQIDGKTAYLTAPDKYELAQKMSYIANNPEVAKRMGKMARKNVKKYDWSEYIYKLDNSLSKLG